MALSPTTDAELQHLYNAIKRLTEFEEYFRELKSREWADEEEVALKIALDSTSQAKGFLWERFIVKFSLVLESNQIRSVPTLKEAVSIQDWAVVNLLVDFVGSGATSTSSALVDAPSTSSALVDAPSSFIPPSAAFPPPSAAFPPPPAAFPPPPAEFPPPSAALTPPSRKQRCVATVTKWLLGRGSVFAKLGTSVIDLLLMVWLSRVMWKPRIKEKSTSNSGRPNSSANASTKRDQKEKEDENMLATRIAEMGLEQILDQSVHIGTFP